MINSLRWRLLLWYAVFITLVIVGLSVWLYQHVHTATIARVTEQLEGSARFLEATLRIYPRHQLEHEGPPRRPAPPPPWENSTEYLTEFFEQAKALGLEPPPSPFTGRPRPPRPQLELSQQLQILASGRPEERPYYAIWRKDKTVLKSEPAPISIECPEAFPEASVARFQLPQGPRCLQLWILGPSGTTILVGRPIESELKQLQNLAWQIVGIGTVMLLLSLCGGWFLANQIWRPLRKMSNTAEKISGRELDVRMEIAALDQELRPLAIVLNAMFDRLQAAFERQTQFTGAASHELRTPLTVLQTNLELALQRERSPGEYQQTLRNCLGATERMRRLTEDLLLLARADQQQQLEHATPVEMIGLTQEVVARLQPLATQRRIDLTMTNTLREPITVSGQVSLLERLLENLIENGLHYTAAHGSVTVQVAQLENQVQLTVSDTGCGIATEHLPHIFERFYRVDSARSRNSGGYGLGLAICQTIVQQHCGTISVASTLDQGTTFTVVLPVNENRR